MTNKINGIDVSECDYINCCSKKAKCIILQDDISSDSQYCESEPNCYFKQLKRLQEENEELKKRCEELDKTTGIFSVRLAKKYKQALEEIREYCEEQNLKADYTACEVLTIIDEVLDEN